MHVLIIPSWYPLQSNDIGGSFFREQALAVQKYGCKVGIVCPQLRSLKQWKTIFFGPYGIRTEIDEGMPTYRYEGMNWFPRMPNKNAQLFVKAGMLAYDQYVNDYGQPDVIHVHSALYGGCLALKIRELYNIPYIITEHFSGYPRGLVSEAGINLTKKVTAGASRKFAVSKSFAKDLATLLNEDINSWEEMPNIVHERFLNFDLNSNVPDEIFNFISVGALSNNKGVHNIIEAFSIAFSENSKIHLKIGGDGISRTMLEQLALKCNVSHKVHFLGKLSREQVLQEVSQSNVLVVASEYETFSVVLVEALALGKPVISTRCGGPESIIQAQDGILVNKGDLNALVEAMLKIYQNYSDYNSKNIRQSCTNRFGDEAVIARLKEIYKQVISSDVK